MAKRFSRHVENFECENCGAEVTGDGYTNHCTRCFWSRHVDVNPGDRAADCGGMMEPIAVDQRHGEVVLVHQCKKCGFMRRNRRSAGDDSESLFRLIARIANQTGHGRGSRS